MRHIESLSDLNAALGEKNRAIVLFKHSTRCPISARALEEYRDLIREEPQAARIRPSGPFPFGSTFPPSIQLVPTPPRQGDFQCVTRRDGKITSVRTY